MYGFALTNSIHALQVILQPASRISISSVSELKPSENQAIMLFAALMSSIDTVCLEPVSFFVFPRDSSSTELQNVIDIILYLVNGDSECSADSDVLMLKITYMNSFYH